ncbi:SET domain-containing protein 4 [Phlyctochytrium planicorne]|nr:SET domain-containing protein 4 [Phlyctochytrium planicorne]
MATKTIEAGEPIIDIPSQLLITIQTVNTLLNNTLSKYSWPLSEHASLALFLSLDQDRIKPWQPYVSLVPENFNCVAMNLPKQLLEVLPRSITEIAERQRMQLARDTEGAKVFMEAINERFDAERFRWGWLAVNTRSVTLNTGAFESRNMNPQPGTPTTALAPFLDMLNHTPSVTIKAGITLLNPPTFRITSESATLRGQEAFINYGPHDNATLLAEYGFVVPENPYDNVSLDHQVFSLKFRNEAKGLRTKIEEELKENGMWGDYCLRSDEESFRLINAIRLLSCLSVPRIDITPHLSRWRAIMQGRAMEMDAEIEEISKKLLQQVMDAKLLEVEESFSKLEAMEEDETMRIQFAKTIAASELRILRDCIKRI